MAKAPGQSIALRKTGLPGMDLRIGKLQTLLDGPRQTFAGQTGVSAASTATQLPSKPIRFVTLKSNGIADIYVGGPDVNADKGFLLSDELTMYIGKLNSIYIWSKDAGAKVYWIGA